ncbi:MULTISPECIES: hypothetical protein [Streptomyces]|uniref:Uncharacterized protein n=1 Tax=Streptomyces europaeiscabiei TaxID=146819 RepID=A0ABU4NQU8_9ACTN|nr:MULTISPECIES: hypothetical protein [Streptomyces]MBP5922164.1 hypothetical protein [Streptomyces sp. LBUM 1483]MDX3555204.1 hypothetical protein [Streptomyces europaeiscabiei]MDX3705218.1 hypothetical protein [Streptomyces europaeiscabiei]MDX3864371.1 hypothetical protein [Streptomyces europaeiscabiei]MDX3871547.1 hypothetical protein [Streptomyces europaeiscabiei]
MSQTEQTQETAAGEQVTEAGEPSERAERIAKAVLVAVALLAAWGLVAAMPNIAYVVTGILICLGWQKARARLGRRSDDDQEPEEERGPDALDAVIALHALSRGNSVLLTALRDELELPDTKAVKALLDQADVPYKAVRTPTGNGPGVHKGDIPPMVSPADAPHDERCCCRSDDNNNADNATGDAPQKGTRVEAIGDGGRLVSELADHTCRNRPAPAPDGD